MFYDSILRLQNDYESAYPNIAIERREHKKDPNRDSNSEFETVNLHIINTNYEDTAFYLCIVANSANSYRSTYAYLNVTNLSKTETYNDETNAGYDQYLMRKTHKFEKFLKENKYVISIIASIVAIGGILFVLLFIYCCSSSIVKNRIIKMNRVNEFDKKTLFNETKIPTMNSLIEKSMSNMRKVNMILSMIFCFIHILFAFFFKEFCICRYE